MNTLTATGLCLVASRYNFQVPTREGPLLFNAASGAVLSVDGADGARLATLICVGTDPGVDIGEITPEDVMNDLLAGGFLVDAGTDELAANRARYWKARTQTPVVLTITTTMDCNLGCYYCYEDRSNDALSITDVEAIVSLAAKRVSDRQRLHVDWYGGEPLMNVEFMEAASAALQHYCAQNRIRYSASVISNGTCWPSDVAAFVARHSLSQVQVSFDGMRANHNRRRRYRRGHEPSKDASSFDLAVELVDRLTRCVRVDVRFNIDRGNKDDLLPFLDFARRRGWFNGAHPAAFQPARLSAYSDRSSFLRQTELSVAEYDALRAQARAAAGGNFAVDESEAPEGFPHPRTSVCAALASDSVVVGADRKLYRCGLQVSEAQRSVGELAEPSRKVALPLFGHRDDVWWDRFDPTVQPRCSRCSFLPVCWGGCPKKHLERDLHALAEQGVYWRRNLARLVAAGVGRAPIDAFEYAELDQFRGGVPPATTCAMG